MVRRVPPFVYAAHERFALCDGCGRVYWGATHLERATRALTALDFPAADGILARLVATHPDFAEAWNKRATLYYMQSRDEESVASIHRTLELEPRHYGAICGFAQICLSLGDTDSALFAFDAALRVNPHLESVREAIDKLLRTRAAATLH